MSTPDPNSDPGDSTPPPISPSDFASASAPPPTAPAAAAAESSPLPPASATATETATGADPEKVAGGLTPTVAAGLACLFSFISGIIFLVIEKRNKFVRFWAMQSTLLGLFGIAVFIALSIVGRIFSYIPLLGTVLIWGLVVVYVLFKLVMFAAYAVSVIKAFSNQIWDIPWLGKIARQQLARLDRNSGDSRTETGSNAAD